MRYFAVTNIGSKYNNCLKNGLNNAVRMFILFNLSVFPILRNFLSSFVSSVFQAACFGSGTILSSFCALQKSIWRFIFFNSSFLDLL